MMNDEVIVMKKELDSLVHQRDCMEKELHAVHEKNKELVGVIEEGEAVNDELRGRIKFLEGQVEAYRYCLNCRR